ncbi:hypothetical protein LCGC14_2039410 [marine sediment metagenome]|uniref:Uncharacterized protein n=1 Tax=marine sediment metagenome TaxID=412755 RepID=A0A0F9FEX6_9ZZZZ
MWWIVPVALTVVALGFMLLARWREGAGDPIDWGPAHLVPCISLCVVAFVMWIAAPMSWFETRDAAWGATEYYESVIFPNMVEEGDDYVVVSNLEAGVWQSGDYNLYGYNKYLRRFRHAQETPIAQTWVYPVPEHLKYVRIEGGKE